MDGRWRRNGRSFTGKTTKHTNHTKRMRFFGFNISLSRESQPAVKKDGTQYALSAGFWPEEARTGTVLSNAYQQVVWVYRAVNALAEQVSNIPFRFSSTTAAGEQLITTGPLVDFYARPHPQINRFEYWELRVIWLMLRGECFRVPIFDDGPFRERALPAQPRRLRSVLILDPGRFQHVVQDHQLIGWRYTGFGPQAPLGSQVFLPEEVWFEKLPNPFDFWRGMSPLSAAATAAGTDYAASLHMRGIMENNGESGAILRTSEQLDPEQREQIVAALRERKRRPGTADRPVFLWGGAEVITPKLSSSDLQFLENRKFSRGEICAAFGVPEEIITSTNNAKYDVMAGARLNFIENRVVPLCRRLEAEEAVAVKAIDPAADGWFDVEDHPVLTEARRARLAAARAGFEMGIPFNDLNRAFDLGFEPLPWGEQGYVPSTMQAVGGLKVEGSKLKVPSSPAEAAPAAAPDPFTRLAAVLTRKGNDR
jgi:phage portal protein BeeE